MRRYIVVARARAASRREGTMRVMAAAVTAASVLAAAMIPAATAARADDAEVGQIVRRHVQPMLIAAGGMAVVVHIDDRTLFFNYGMADVARKEPITSDVLFNLASVTKVFISTLLARAVKQGEVALEDPVDKYVTELQQGGDIRKVTARRAREPHLGPHPHAAAIRALASRAVQAPRLHPLSQLLEGGRRAYAGQAGALFQQRLLFARARAAAAFQHPDRQAHGGAAHFATRDEFDGDAGADRDWARPARAGVPPPRGAGLQRRRASRGRARQPAGHVPMARHRTDLFLRPRHGGVPRRQSRRAAQPSPAAGGDGVRADRHVHGSIRVSPRRSPGRSCTTATS